MTTNFINDGTALNAEKQDAVPIGGNDPTKFVAATDWNQFRKALVDIQTYALTDHRVFDVADKTKYATIEAYNGNPNGVLTRRKGSVVLDYMNGTAYQNQDGATAWKVIGGFAYSDVSANPDADPVSANALDDEFNEVSALDGRWSGLNTADLAATPYVMGNSSIVMTKKASTNTLSGYQQAFTPGSSDWTFQAKISCSLIAIASGGFPAVGIIVGDGTKYLLGSIFFSNRASPGFGLHYWTNFSTFNSDLFTSSPLFPGDPPIITSGCSYHRTLWIRLQKSGTNAIVSWSPNGYDFSVVNSASAFGSLGTIATIGIGAQNSNSLPISPRFLHFRRIS